MDHLCRPRGIKTDQNIKQALKKDTKITDPMATNKRVKNLTIPQPIKVLKQSPKTDTKILQPMHQTVSKPPTANNIVTEPPSAGRKVVTSQVRQKAPQPPQMGTKSALPTKSSPKIIQSQKPKDDLTSHTRPK